MEEHGNDMQLVEASREGDTAAFETLVHRYQARMLNIACRITGDYEDACEVVQDAFVSAYRSLNDFRGDSRFTTWLTSITVNLSRNSLTRSASRRGHPPEPFLGETGSVSLELPSPMPTAEELLQRRDIKRKVHECLGRLPVPFREVMVLRDLEELSYEEIAGVLDLSGGTVRSRLARARDTMKECLKKWAGLL